MFTGIIEEVGTIRSIRKQGQSLVIVIEAGRILEDVRIGDSIAVNGVCLTVTAFDGQSVTMDVMPETYRLTSLRTLQPGGKVNLERSLPAGGRFGGHIVQGHVDGTALVEERREEGNAVVFSFRPHDRKLLRYIVPKGSIAVDGISLTVVDVLESSFTVSIIPHTLAQTTLSGKRPGDIVNLETDILGRYIERLLTFAGDRPNAAGETLSLDFLRENGFVRGAKETE